MGEKKKKMTQSWVGGEWNGVFFLKDLGEKYKNFQDLTKNPNIIEHWRKNKFNSKITQKQTHNDITSPPTQNNQEITQTMHYAVPITKNRSYLKGPS